MPSSSCGVCCFQSRASPFLSGGGEGDQHGRKQDSVGGSGVGEEAELWLTCPLLRGFRNGDSDRNMLS